MGSILALSAVTSFSVSSERFLSSQNSCEFMISSSSARRFFSESKSKKLLELGRPLPQITQDSRDVVFLYHGYASLL
jgi:hypothetical protein